MSKGLPSSCFHIFGNIPKLVTGSNWDVRDGDTDSYLFIYFGRKSCKVTIQKVCMQGLVEFLTIFAIYQVKRKWLKKRNQHFKKWELWPGGSLRNFLNWLLYKFNSLVILDLITHSVFFNLLSFPGISITVWGRKMWRPISLTQAYDLIQCEPPIHAYSRKLVNL
jgi:hypothetical protein